MLASGGRASWQTARVTIESGERTAGRLLRWRRELPIVERTAHLVNHSLGPMPRGAEAELAAYARAWRERGVRAWNEGWWELPVTTGDLLAPILGVAPGTVAMHPNVSVGLAVFLSALDYPAERNRVIALAEDFHTDRYILLGEERRRALVSLVESGDPAHVDLDRLLAAIDERTRLVVVSHVLFSSSFLIDAEEVARRCRAVGALLVLDVYQSAGVVPLALADWGVDAAVGGSVKWLCGGPGAGFLYVRPELAPTLAPAVTGWQADAEPFAFRGGAIRRAEGAWRFLTGTPTVPSLVACRPGYRMVAEVGVDSIRARSLELTARLIARADERGIEVRSPRDAACRGGVVTLFHPDAERICRGLLENEVLCDFRPGFGVRLGPHFFNTEAECDRAVELFAELADAGP